MHRRGRAVAPCRTVICAVARHLRDAGARAWRARAGAR